MSENPLAAADGDRLLIMLLVMLLSREKASKPLICALIYILMF